jgi:ketosteroid isomerase-like protein
MRLIASALAALCLLVVPPLAWSQRGNPPASAKESEATSGKGMTTAEQIEKGSGNVEEQIKTLQAQLVQTLLKGDTSFFEEYFADEATIIHGDGKLYTTAEDYEIKGLKSGTIKYESIDVPESKIRSFGNTAVVTSLTSGKGTINGKPFSFEGRITRVWVKQKSGWKMVASQYTRVAPAQ